MAKALFIRKKEKGKKHHLHSLPKNQPGHFSPTSYYLSKRKLRTSKYNIENWAFLWTIKEGEEASQLRSHPTYARLRMWHLCVALLCSMNGPCKQVCNTHYCVALSRCAISHVTLLHPHTALKRCQSIIRQKYSCTLNNTEPHTCYDFKRNHMFCIEWVGKGVYDTALLSPTKIEFPILQLKAGFPKN